MDSRKGRGRHSGQRGEVSSVLRERKGLSVLSERRKKNSWKDGNKGSGLQRIEDALT